MYRIKGTALLYLRHYKRHRRYLATLTADEREVIQCMNY